MTGNSRIVVRGGLVFLGLVLGACPKASPQMLGTGGQGGFTSSENASDGGAGGAGGTGTPGNTGGSVGTGGVGGQPPTPPKLNPLLGNREPASDWFNEEKLVAIGQLRGVCPDVERDCEGDDPFDEWEAVTTSEGEHCIELEWAPDVCAPGSSNCSDLDLFLRDAVGELLDESRSTIEERERICIELKGEGPFFVTVLAIDTRGETQTYTLAIEKSE